VIMVWVYYSAQIFLFAAEVARAADKVYPRRSEQVQDTDSVAI
jgi:uncharacterized BrkB/YihY/UPF0761 family membrane protein